MVSATFSFTSVKRQKKKKKKKERRGKKGENNKNPAKWFDVGKDGVLGELTEGERTGKKSLLVPPLFP